MSHRRFAAAFACWWLLFAGLGALWALATPIGASPDAPSQVARAVSVVRGQWLGPAVPGTGSAVTTYVWVPKTYLDPGLMAHCYMFKENVERGVRPPSRALGPDGPHQHARRSLPAGLLPGRRLALAPHQQRGRHIPDAVGQRFAGGCLPRPGRSHGPGVVDLGAHGPGGGGGGDADVTVPELVRQPQRHRSGGRHCHVDGGHRTGGRAPGKTTQGPGYRPGHLHLGVGVDAPYRAGLAGGGGGRPGPGGLGTASPILLKRRDILGGSGAVGVAGVGALLWVLLARATAVGTNFGVLPRSSSYGHITTFVVGKLPSLLQQGVGNFGWLDTPAPWFTLAAWATLCVALVGAVLLLGSKRALWSVLLALLASFIVPVASLIGAARNYGYIGQGRYFLAIWVSVPIVAAGFVGLDARSRAARRLSVTVGLLVAGGQALAYYWALRRYTVGIPGPLGLSGGSRSATGPRQWQPPVTGWWLLGMFVVLCAVYGVATAHSPGWQQRAAHPARHLHESGAAGSAQPDRIKTDRDIAVAGAPSPAAKLEPADRGWGEPG